MRTSCGVWLCDLGSGVWPGPSWWGWGMSVSRAKGRKAQLPLAFVMRTEQRGLLGSPLGQWRVRLAQGVLAWLGLGCCGWAEVSVWSYAGLALHLPCSGVAHALGRQGRMSLRCDAFVFAISPVVLPPSRRRPHAALSARGRSETQARAGGWPSRSPDRATQRSVPVTSAPSVHIHSKDTPPVTDTVAMSCRVPPAQGL